MTCHWTAETGWRNGEEACNETHCGMRGTCANHLPAGTATCPACIAKVRADLSDIVRMAPAVGVEAEYAGVDSEAANLAGPHASIEQLTGKREAGVWVEWEDPNHPGQLRHPYAVVVSWCLALQDHSDVATVLRLTFQRAADYVGAYLSSFAQSSPMEFEELAGDLRRCRAHLEAVLGDSRKPDLGAPCPRCTEAGDEPARRLAKHWGSSEERDRWICPECGATWTETDYRLRVEGAYLEHATELTASQLHRVTGVAVGTIRQWAARGRVRKRGRRDGVQLYDVADVKAGAARHAGEEDT